MAIAIDQETRLELRRHFRAPVAAVYAAWTDPAQLREWMAPGDDFGPTDATVELRVGGRFRLDMHMPDGTVCGHSGVYREVARDKKLVYTWVRDSAPEEVSIVTVTFAAAGGGTDLTLIHERFADTRTRDEHEHGWTGCLARFDRYLSR